MTGFLVGAVIVLTALWLLHLLVLLGVVRRLREHESRLANQAPAGSGVMTAPLGQRIPEFSTRGVDEQPVTSARLDGPTLVGFFSPSCDACHERLGDFRDSAAAHHGTTLAVVVRDGGDAQALVSELDGTGTVILEDMGGTLTAAFGVRGFPAFASLDADRVLVAQGYEPPRPPRA